MLLCGIGDEADNRANSGLRRRLAAAQADRRGPAGARTVAAAEPQLRGGDSGGRRRRPQAAVRPAYMAPGQRGATRVIYAHMPWASWVWLLMIYPKNVRENLSRAEAQAIGQLAMEIDA